MSILIVSLALIFWQIFGFNDATSLPLLNVKLRDPSKFPLVTSIILAVGLLFLWIEWKQSDEIARRVSMSRIRFGITLILAFAAVWINLPILTKGTSLASVPRLWYVIYICLGVSIGFCAGSLLFVTVAVRSKKEAVKYNLPRTYVVTRAVWWHLGNIAFGLIFIVLLASYFAPKEFLSFVPLFVGLPVMAILAAETHSLFFFRDADGNRVPFQRRISNFKEIFATHDYLRHIASKGMTEIEKAKIDLTATPQTIQKSFQQYLAKNVPLVIKPLFDFAIIPDHIDDDPNVVPKVKLMDSDAKTVKVRVWPQDENPPRNIKELDIEISLIEKYATEFQKINVGRKYIQNEAMGWILARSVSETLEGEIENQFPLHIGAYTGNQKFVEKHLTKGKDINERDPAGWTPLLHAVANGYSKMAKMMLEKGANPDVSNLQKITPLMYAARYGNLETAKILLNFGATLDLQDIFGDTALAVAVREGQESLVRLFISKGAKIDTQNRETISPLDYAHKLGHGKIASLLRKAK